MGPEERREVEGEVEAADLALEEDGWGLGLVLVFLRRIERMVRGVDEQRISASSIKRARGRNKRRARNIGADELFFTPSDCRELSAAARNNTTRKTTEGEGERCDIPGSESVIGASSTWMKSGLSFEGPRACT